MKILFLQKRLLYPADFGGKIRTLNVLRYLARWHDITYLCNLQEGEEAYLPAMAELGVHLETIPWKEVERESLRFYWELAMNLASPYPFTVAKDYDPRLHRRAKELLQSGYDLIICDFLQMSRNCAGIDGTPKLLFEHNVEAQIFHRHATTDPGWLRRRYMAHQWHKMRRYEEQVGQTFDAVIAVSPQDSSVFQQDYGWHHVQVIDTGVETEYFHPRAQTTQSDQIVFVGSMDWLPNEDGVRFFVEEVWPSILLARPNAVFHIVGRSPSSRVQRLGRVHGVHVVGTVPDVRPYLAEAAVVVVPLLVGGGTRIKIFEAMAMGKTVVSTSLGAEGLDVISGEHLVLADSPEKISFEIVRLLNDISERKRIGDAARRLVCERFSAERVARQFEQICLDTVASYNSARALAS